MSKHKENDMAVHELIANSHKAKVHALLKANRHGGMTDHEIADALGMYLSSVNATRNALMKAGYVTDSGMKRPSGRGGQATVWRAVR